MNTRESFRVRPYQEADLASYQFYNKRGFQLVASKRFQNGSENKSFVYEYSLKGRLL